MQADVVGNGVAAAETGASVAVGHLVEDAAKATKAVASGDLEATAHAGLQAGEAEATAVASSSMQEKEHLQQEVGHVVAEVKEAEQALEDGLHGNFTGIEDHLNPQEMGSFLDGVGGAVSKLKGFLSSAKGSAGDKPVDRSKIKPLERTKAEKAFAKYSHLGQLVGGELVCRGQRGGHTHDAPTALPSPNPACSGVRSAGCGAWGGMAPLNPGSSNPHPFRPPEPWFLITLTPPPPLPHTTGGQHHHQGGGGPAFRGSRGRHHRLHLLTR